MLLNKKIGLVNVLLIKIKCLCSLFSKLLSYFLFEILCNLKKCISLTDFLCLCMGFLRFRLRVNVELMFIKGNNSMKAQKFF